MKVSPLIQGKTMLGELCIEAVTVGPTVKDGEIVPPPPINTPEDLEPYVKEYMPIKFGSALFSKLKKQYWKQPHVAGKPFVFAIADFSATMSMVHSQPALERYLFGYEHIGALDERGKLIITPVQIGTHQWGDKAPIPSSFFRLPEAAHVSAVISSNGGTIAKFNRMGILGKFGSKQVLIIREGLMVDHNANALEPKMFRVIVNSAGYEEDWIEGLNVYHNPNAAIPLPMEIFPGAAHHFCDESGQVTSHTPEFHPISSVTKHYLPVDVEEVLTAAGDQTYAVWTVKSEQAK